MPGAFLSAADVDVDPVRRRFPSSTEGVRLAGAEPMEPVGRPREMALRRDFKVLLCSPQLACLLTYLKQPARNGEATKTSRWKRLAGGCKSSKYLLEKIKEMHPRCQGERGRLIYGTLGEPVSEVR